MLHVSPRFLFSPRFLALPVIALTVIVALAQVSRQAPPAGAQVAAPKIYRAVNCASPANAAHASCAVASDHGASRVR